MKGNRQRQLLEEVRKLARSHKKAKGQRPDPEEARKFLARYRKTAKRDFREHLELALPLFADTLVRLLCMRGGRRVETMGEADRVVIARGDEVVVGFARIPPDHVVITCGGEVVGLDRGELAILRGNEACVDFTQLPHVEAPIAPDVWSLITTLIHLLQDQSALAGLTLSSAKDEIAVNRKRKVGTDNSVKHSTRRNRAKVEQLMRNCLAKREDATKHFGSWERLYGYTIRHLRNIWKAVQETENQKGNR